MLSTAGTKPADRSQVIRSSGDNEAVGAPGTDTSQTSQVTEYERKEKHGELLMLLMGIMRFTSCWGAFMMLCLLLLLILVLGRHQFKF